MRVGLAGALVAIWVLLWGEASFANVLSGVLVAVALLTVFPSDAREGAPRFVVRPVAFLRLVGYFIVQLVVSNVLLTREVLSRRSRIRTGVVACELRTGSTRIMTIMANLLALTPGTMTVDAEDDPVVLHIHVLQLHDVDDVRAQVAHLEWLVLRAFGPRGVYPDAEAPRGGR